MSAARSLLLAAAATLACGPSAAATITHRSGKESAVYRAYLDFALGDDEKALETALALEGETSFLVLEQALVAARRGDRARMLERAERAVALDADNAEAHDLLARAHFRLADEGIGGSESRRAAEDHATALIRLRRADAQVFERLADLHGEAARAAEAGQDFAAASDARKKQRGVLEAWAERLHDDVPWRRLAELAREVGDTDGEVVALRAAARRDPSDLALVQELADLLQRVGRCEEAMPILEAALSQAPLDVYAAIGLNVNLGECANVLGWHDVAETALRRALDEDPTNLIAGRELASALWAAGRRADAQRFLDQVGDRVTRRVGFLEVRAGWELEHGLTSEALAHGEAALAEAKALGITTISFADLHALLGSVHLEAGRPVEAEASARRALEIEPGSADAAFLLAEALWEAGQRSAAVDQLDLFDRRAGGAVPHLLRRARWDANHGRRHEAVAGALGALDAGLRSGRLALRGLDVLSREVADILSAAGRPDEAESVLRKALARSPGHALLLSDLASALVGIGQPAAARAVIDQAGDSASSLAVERRIRWELDHRMPDAALARALREHERVASAGASGMDLARSTALVGEAHLAAADASTAVAWLERAMASVPRPTGRLLAVRARALEKAGRHEEALAAVAAALAGEPEDPALGLARIRLELRTGRTSDAIASAAGLVASRPRSVALRNQVALTLQEGGEAQEARRVVDLTLRDFPRSVPALLMSATLHDRRGDVLAAGQDARRAIELAPESPTALNALGYMLASRGLDLDEAVKLLRRAVEMAPHEPAYLDSLGWALRAQGKLAEAERHLEAAVARDRDPVVVMHLGTLRQDQGRIADALALYREALRFGLDEDVARVTSAVDELARQGGQR